MDLVNLKAKWLDLLREQDRVNKEIQAVSQMVLQLEKKSAEAPKEG